MSSINLVCPFHLFQIDALCIEPICHNYSRCLCQKCSCQNKQERDEVVLLKDFEIKLKTIYSSLPANVNKIYGTEIDEFYKFYNQRKHLITLRKLNGFAELLSNIDQRNIYLGNCAEKQIQKYVYKQSTIELRGHFEYWNQVHGVSISPDNKLLASSSQDGEIIIWDLITFKLLKRLSLGNTVYIVQFSKFSNILAAVDNHTNKIHLWNISLISNIQALDVLIGHTSYVSNIVFTDFDHSLISSSNDQTIRIWDLNYLCTKPSIFYMMTPIQGLSVFKDLMAGQELKGIVSIWNLKSKKRLFHWQALKQAGCKICFSHNAQLLVSQNEISIIKIWAISRRSGNLPTLVRKFKVGEFIQTGLMVSKNSNFFASTQIFKNCVLIYDIVEGKETQKLNVNCGYRGSMNQTVDISQNLDYIVTGGKDGYINLYERILIQQ